ncbi:hypothetical protein TDB9533_00682 [Thalassocella blandensis]|nr:hypothetical protein TDB9533_00682 [Thalassocella blandensis]
MFTTDNELAVPLYRWVKIIFQCKYLYCVLGDCMKTLKIRKIKLSVVKTMLVLAALTFFTPAIAAPLLNGVAMYSELGSEKFMAGLYSTGLSSSADDILASELEKRIEVRVVDERLSTRRFKRMWIEGIAINSSTTELETHAENMAKFSNMLKVRMKKGDVFAIEKKPEFINISLNGTSLGELDDPAFFDLLLRTWIGFVPLSSDFRDNLLKQGSIKPELLSRYEQIQPSEERVTAIAQAISSRQEAEGEEVAAASQGDDTKQNTRIALKPAPVKVAVAAPAVTAPSTGGSSSSSASETKSEPERTPEPVKVAVAPKPKPKSLPKQKPVDIALPPRQEELDESIFDDEEADVELTAEGLLIQQLYYSRLANYTQNFARYPRIAMERGREGSLLIRVTINREGEVMATEFIEETESYSLNKEAKRAVKRASPFPAMPTEISGEEFSFMFRLTFNLTASSDAKKLHRLAAN